MEIEEIKIGNQIWMTSNLNVTHFCNGDEILEAKTISEWEKADQMKIAAWCHYENNTKIGMKFGKLYNWHAVIDVRNIAPKNYRVPKDEDFEILSDFYGGSEISGKFLKNHNQFNEEINNERISNAMFFNALAGGVRFWSFEFYGINEYAFFWSCSEYNNNFSWHRVLSKNYNCFGRVNQGGKGFGMSIRCIKNDLISSPINM